MSIARPGRGVAFARPRRLRLLSGVASVGVLAGMSLLAAGPAGAATDAECIAGAGGNVVDANAGGTRAQIQTLLDADVSVICLTGTFSIGARMVVRAPVTFHGYPHADLVSTGGDQLIVVASPVPVVIENMRLAGGRYLGAGGAIQAYGLTVRDSTFEDNRDSHYGGAIYARGDVDIARSTFTANQAPAGGAIFMNAGFDIRVVDSVFRGNVGDVTGYGAAITAYGVTTVESSTFEDNSGPGNGSALKLFGPGTITNSTFVGNTDSVYGNPSDAVSATDVVTISNSTFLDNGGAVAGSTGLTLRNNVFAGAGAQVRSITGTAEVVDAGGNVFTSAAATEVALGPPLLSTRFGVTSSALFATGSLADNGGRTPTLALGPASPAIGAATGSPATDQRGEPRPLIADAGAFQYIAPAVVVPAAPTLPPTGSESGWMAALATALLAAGAALGILRRQPRRASQRS